MIAGTHHSEGSGHGNNHAQTAQSYGRKHFALPVLLSPKVFSLLAKDHEVTLRIAQAVRIREYSAYQQQSPVFR